ncbi:hypothetical protein RDI58_015063 [Solanum bulbocastanum]|uniref:Uncharacterized protein n=1 Tax=Solanum bulbocastanum TaxID=147425 RepID=A0AAN8YEL9_SOLBU
MTRKTEGFWVVFGASVRRSALCWLVAEMGTGVSLVLGVHRSSKLAVVGCF